MIQKLEARSEFNRQFAKRIWKPAFLLNGGQP
jgi:hypothetical protein